MTVLADTFKPSTFVDAFTFIGNHGWLIWHKTVEQLVLSGSAMGVGSFGVRSSECPDEGVFEGAPCCACWTWPFGVGTRPTSVRRGRAGTWKTASFAIHGKSNKCSASDASSAARSRLRRFTGFCGKDIALHSNSGGWG